MGKSAGKKWTGSKDAGKALSVKKKSAVASKKKKSAMFVNADGSLQTDSRPQSKTKPVKNKTRRKNNRLLNPKSSTSVSPPKRSQQSYFLPLADEEVERKGPVAPAKKKKPPQQKHAKITPKSSNDYTNKSRKPKKKLSPAAPVNLKEFAQRSKKRKRSDINNNNKPVEFDLQLPCKQAGKHVTLIPWMKQNNYSSHRNQSTTAASPKKPSNKIRLPTDDVDPTWLAHLNDELEWFAEYVRLTPAEWHARQAAIEELTQLASEIPYCPNRDSPISFEPFGSFAAPAVCTFASDVDLALWGAVYELPSMQKKRSQQIATMPTTTTTATAQSQVFPSQKERTRKWHQVLEGLDDENILSPGNNDHLRTTKEEEKEQESQKGFSQKKSVIADNVETDGGPKKKNQSDEVLQVDDNSNKEEIDEDESDDMPLFVLDRTGATHSVVGDVGSASPQTSTTVTASSNGTCTETAIDVDNDHDDGESDKDDADKLEGMKKAAGGESEAAMSTRNNDSEMKRFVSLTPEDEHHNETNTAAHPLEDDPEAHYREELEHETWENEEEDENDDDDDDNDYQNMQVGFVNSVMNTARMLGDDTLVRKRDAQEALSLLHRKLRKSNLQKTSHFIRHARVPIIKFMSKFGFEVDICIGGMNGADTSLYAREQALRYRSFAPVVLALKIIMGQQELDTPFTGGLGSFKLYVLVAHHMQQHLNLGGRDHPGEVLLSFLFRYGGSATGDHCVKEEETKTLLSRDAQVTCQDTGCDADLSNVFKVEECCHLFGSVWKRLWIRMRRTGAKTNPQTLTSLLAELIHVDRLCEKRQTSLNIVDRWIKREAKRNNTKPPPSLPNYRPRLKQPPKPTMQQSKQSNSPPKWPSERSATQLAAGYGVRMSQNEARPRKRIKTY